MSQNTATATSASRFKVFFERNITFLGPLLTLILLIVVFAALAPSTFLSQRNLLNVMSQVSVLAILAAGLTFVLLLGQMDLSVATVAVLAGMVSAVIYSGMPMGFPFIGAVTFPMGNQVVAVIISLLLAGLLGLVSGLITARLGIPSFIGTLGMLEIARGLAFYWSDGKNIYEMMPLSEFLGSSFLFAPAGADGADGPAASGTFPGIPVIVLVAVVTLVIGHIVLTYTRFGRYVYMSGANPKAAQLSGVPVKRVTTIVFVISGVLAGFGGIVLIGRIGSAQATSGDGLLLPAIAAVVLGGTSLFGGVGSMKHTAVGLLLYGVLNNGLDQIDINIYLKPFARGIFLLAAIALNIAALRVASRANTRGDAGGRGDQPDGPEPVPHMVSTI